MKGCSFFLLLPVLSFFVIAILMWGEYKLLCAVIDNEYSDWIYVILVATPFGIVFIYDKIIGWLFPGRAVRGSNFQQDDSIAKIDNLVTMENDASSPLPITSKSLGGFSREQMGEIYLLGILFHQIYYYAVSDNLSESLQERALNVQKRLFITVFPKRNLIDYSDFTEKFTNKIEFLSESNISEYVERSIGILSKCNKKQIRKLQSLYKNLAASYFDIGGGDNAALISLYNMVDSELSSLAAQE